MTMAAHHDDPAHHEDPGPTPPMGADTVLEATDRAARLGYVGTMSTTDDGDLRCGSCDTHIEAATYRVDYEHRLEGTSDVADSMLLVAGTCPSCTDRSTVLLGYGPNATAQDADALTALDLSNAQPLPAQVGRADTR